MNNLKIAFWIIMLIGFTCSCKKYLDKKPDMGLYVPDKWQDLQALLDNNQMMNFGSAIALPELLGGDIYVADNVWRSATTDERDNYNWKSDARNIEGWVLPYSSQIYISNVALDNIKKVVNQNEKEAIDNVEGSALFFRSLGFYNLAQVFCLPYNINSVGTELGLVLKLNGNLEEKKNRSSIADTYKQIINDLKMANELLPNKASTTFRPSKLAAQTLLARVYLSISDYDNAELYTDMALSAKNTLLNYNDLMLASSPKMPPLIDNPEVIFFCRYQSTPLTIQSNARIDLDLYNTYETNDLRKTLFFQANTGSSSGSYRFKGSYYGQSPSLIFNGLSTDELYFIKMECLTRKGRYAEAITMLNDFLKKRYVTGTAKTYIVTNAQQALQAILLERRKELVYRGQRWTDIRRLNLDGANITLRRVIEGTTYELPPNDLRYALLIPEIEVIRFGLQQNRR